MQLQKVSPLCYEFVDIGLYGVDRVLISFFSPAVVRFTDGRTLVSKQALHRESSSEHVLAALARWSVGGYEEVDGKELDTIIHPLNI